MLHRHQGHRRQRLGFSITTLPFQGSIQCSWVASMTGYPCCADRGSKRQRASMATSFLRRHGKAQAECSSEQSFAHIGRPLGSHQHTRATPVRPWPNVTCLVLLRMCLPAARWASSVCTARARCRLSGAAFDLSVPTLGLSTGDQHVELVVRTVDQAIELVHVVDLFGACPARNA